jgi:parvulin-like peptidyl-prolyl isomerase
MKGEVKMRTRLGVGVIIAILAATFNVAHAQPASAPHYTHAELRKMVQEAHTEQQFKELASYFRSRQQAYEQQAQTEKLEWEHRSENVTSVAAKYPRPVDSSKNRYEYFTYEAGQMSEQAAHYERLSGKAQ